MTLYDLTGQESGIVIYPGHTAIVLNWFEYGEGCLPFVGPCEMVTAAACPSIWARQIVANDCESVPEEVLKYGKSPEGIPEGGGKVYRIGEDVIVIAPFNWN